MSADCTLTTSQQGTIKTTESKCLNDNECSLFRFFGMIVGKAIYEGILLKCTFTRFFLNRFSESPNGGSKNQVDDLCSLDPELYNNLMKLKYFEGDA